jgi:hypothetical protein
MLDIKFNRNPKSFRPGENLDATFTWDNELPGRTITLRVRWFTIGKGTTSSFDFYEEAIPLNAPQGEKPLRIKLPRGPLSCEGRLLTIQWSVRIEITKTYVQKEELFYLTYSDLPIRLNSFPVAEENKTLMAKFTGPAS